MLSWDSLLKKLTEVGATNGVFSSLADLYRKGQRPTVHRLRTGSAADRLEGELPSTAAS